MRAWLLEFVRCPYCSGPLRKTVTVAEDGDVCTSGLLNCVDCRVDYPIVAGVPILRFPHETLDALDETTVAVHVPGPKTGDVAAAVRSGNALKALELLLNPFTMGGAVLPQSFAGWDQPAVQEGGGASTPQDRGLIGDLKNFAKDTLKQIDFVVTAKANIKKQFLPIWRSRLARFLQEHGKELSALQLIDLYYRFYSNSEIGNYFSYRYTQPRHLAGLCVASVLRQHGGPVLDVACGVGHLSHYFSYGRPEAHTVGLDRDFFRLYLAKNYMAPQAEFVCAEADTALPFADGVFSGVFCSDAFFCFLHRASAVREMQRVATADGNLVLTRTRNAAVPPLQGYEFEVDGYRRLFAASGLKAVLLSEDTLVGQYLSRQGLDLTVDEPDRLPRAEWLSVFASRSGEPFKRHAPWSDWPHAIGRLGINPLYVGTAAAGQLELKLRFPSEWYTFQNRKFLEYAPEQCTVPNDVLAAVQKGERPAAAEALIDRFVLVGMPERYLAGSRT